MPFNMDCPNKGCGACQTPWLDKDTNKVYCSSCNKEIVDVSPFAKNSMRQNKQFRVKEKKSFSVKCASCQFEDRRFAADAIAVMAEYRRTDRPADEADEVGPERGQRPRQRRFMREVKLAENQAGHGAVDEKIVPLDRGTDG